MVLRGHDDRHGSTRDGEVADLLHAMGIALRQRGDDPHPVVEEVVPSRSRPCSLAASHGMTSDHASGIGTRRHRSRERLRLDRGDIRDGRIRQRGCARHRCTGISRWHRDNDKPRITCTGVPRLPRSTPHSFGQGSRVCVIKPHLHPCSAQRKTHGGSEESAADHEHRAGDGHGHVARSWRSTSAPRR